MGHISQIALQLVCFLLTHQRSYLSLASRWIGRSRHIWPSQFVLDFQHAPTEVVPDTHSGERSMGLPWRKRGGADDSGLGEDFEFKAVCQQGTGSCLHEGWRKCLGNRECRFRWHIQGGSARRRERRLSLRNPPS